MWQGNFLVDQVERATVDRSNAPKQISFCSADNMCFKRWKKIAPVDAVQQHTANRSRVNKTLAATPASVAQ
jgi:hypothetical protein